MLMSWFALILKRGMDRFLKQNRKASLDVIVCYWKPSSNKRFSGNTEYFRAEYFLEEYFLAEYFSAGYFLVNYFSEEYLMAVCFIRDAKSGRSGRYICAIFFQLVLIFGAMPRKKCTSTSAISTDSVSTISISVFHGSKFLRGIFFIGIYRVFF